MQMKTCELPLKTHQNDCNRKVSNRCHQEYGAARILMHCLSECAVTLKNGLSTPLMIKRGLATWHRNFIPKQKPENVCPHKNLFTDVNGSIVYHN